MGGACSSSAGGEGIDGEDEPGRQPKAADGIFDLSGQSAERVGAAISANGGMRELTLTGCDLSALPETIGLLTKLEKLVVSENKLTELPAAIKGCVSLTSIDANDNQLKTLPAELGELTELTQLLLYKNQLTAVPETLGKLAKLDPTAVTQTAAQQRRLRRLLRDARLRIRELMRSIRDTAVSGLDEFAAAEAAWAQASARASPAVHRSRRSIRSVDHARSRGAHAAS